jgi:hypothetical protein
MRYFYALLALTAVILITIKPGLAIEILTATLAVVGVLLFIPDDEPTK